MFGLMEILIVAVPLVVILGFAVVAAFGGRKNP